MNFRRFCILLSAVVATLAMIASNVGNSPRKKSGSKPLNYGENIGLYQLNNEGGYPLCPGEGDCPIRSQIQMDSPWDRYTIVKKLGQGFFGETWLVTESGSSKDLFVVKKIKKQVMGHTSFYQSGLREQHFGKLVSGSSWLYGVENVARFKESFQDSDEIYLVSFYEGISLSSLIYNIHGEGNVPSAWWRWLRQSAIGRKTMQGLIFQLLKAVYFCHRKGIVHRDLKPTNIVLCIRVDGSCSGISLPIGDVVPDIHLRIIDFGSALDDFSIHYLYQPDGPSRAEQCALYMAPEALDNDDWLQASPSSRAKYDMWTVGQIIMELIFGTPDVFSITTLESHTLAMKLSPADNMNRFFLLRVISLSEFCITVPAVEQFSSSIRKQCSDEMFLDYVRRRDPLHLGFQDLALMHLVRHLLEGNPDQRLTSEEALKHRYFLNSYTLIGSG